MERCLSYPHPPRHKSTPVIVPQHDEEDQQFLYIPAKSQHDLPSSPVKAGGNGEVPKKFWWGKLWLLLYTLARIVNNVYSVTWDLDHCFCFDKVKTVRTSNSFCSEVMLKYGAPFDFEIADYHQLMCLTVSALTDGIAKPIITGLAVDCFLTKRFHSHWKVHVWSWRMSILLAAFSGDFGFCPGVLKRRKLSFLGPWIAILHPLLQWGARLIQLHLTNHKLRALGWHQTAWCSRSLVVLMLSMLIFQQTDSAVDLHEKIPRASMFWHAVDRASEALLFEIACVAGVQSIALLVAACGALTSHQIDHSLRPTVKFLFLTSLLVLLEPVLFYYMKVYSRDGYSLHQTCLVFLQIGLMVLLSGICSSASRPMQSFESLAQVGFAITGKRVRVLGYTNNESSHCIASFPGKYSSEWDRVVRLAKTCRSLPSLACVFLSDDRSGLGKHAKKPDMPGGCWCHTIYGRMPPTAYISEVEQRHCSDDELLFNMADAHAMGQIFLLKKEQDDLSEDWLKEKARAMRQAEARCQEHDAKAPWGCYWFEVWVKNIQVAKLYEQTLHVFYFEGRKGQGKLRWDELKDPNALEKARKVSGLGSSQTVEVAYLDKEGIDYMEHDIKDFEEVMKSDADDAVTSMKTDAINAMQTQITRWRLWTT